MNTLLRLPLFAPKLFNTTMSAAMKVWVTEAESARIRKAKGENVRPAHWDDTNKDGSAGFHNPWASFRKHDRKDLMWLPTMWTKTPSIPADIKSLIPVRTPTWGAGNDPSNIKATWLGHACFLLELPAVPGASRGVRVLFDPVFEDRCSPFSFLGPKRFTPTPCAIEDIPELDAVVISHNHYDHMSSSTLTSLSKRARTPHFFVPLGADNRTLLSSLGVPESHIHVLDWWEGRRMSVSLPSTSKAGEGEKEGEVEAVVDITATPCQHMTNRGVLDRMKTLWASWVVSSVSSPSSPSSDAKERENVKVYFAGDTGYRSVQDNTPEDEWPTCPAFKEIGARFGGFDLALIPIGAYEQRRFMSPMHVSPVESVMIFQDVKAKRAIGMHWGTWVLTIEPVDEPPKALAAALDKAGLSQEVFGVCDVGETVFV